MWKRLATVEFTQERVDLAEHGRWGRFLFIGGEGPCLSFTLFLESCKIPGSCKRLSHCGSHYPHAVFACFVGKWNGEDQVEVAPSQLIFNPF
jgi:hypothetical protein